MKSTMSQLIGLGLLITAVASCNMSKYGGSEDNYVTVTPAPQPSISPTPAASPKPSPPSIIEKLKRSAGKYPYELKLMENKEFQARLKKLMGDDFAAMKEHFNVETPIEIDSGVLMTNACEAHNCGANMYYLFIDLARDNINVVHTENEKTDNYFEKGRIKLPQKFADEMVTEPIQ
jgi:hypothetical protein